MCTGAGKRGSRGLDSYLARNAGDRNSCRTGNDRSVLCGKRELGQTEEHAQQDPKIRIDKKVLIKGDAAIAHREKRQKNQPENVKEL